MFSVGHPKLRSVSTVDGRFGKFMLFCRSATFVPPRLENSSRRRYPTVNIRLVKLTWELAAISLPCADGSFTPLTVSVCKAQGSRLAVVSSIVAPFAATSALVTATMPLALLSA